MGWTFQLVMGSQLLYHVTCLFYKQETLEGLFHPITEEIDLDWIERRGSPVRAVGELCWTRYLTHSRLKDSNKIRN